MKRFTLIVLACLAVSFGFDELHLADEAYGPVGVSLEMRRLDAAVSRQSREQLEALVTQGLLLPDGDGYQVLFAFRNGQATLNGRTLPPL